MRRIVMWKVWLAVLLVLLVLVLIAACIVAVVLVQSARFFPDLTIPTGTPPTS